MTREAPPSILLFAKAPITGRVKTRLAAGIGDTAALQLYRDLGASQLRRLPPDWPLEIHFDPVDARADMADWLGRERAYFAQATGDLGARLATGIEGAFRRGARAVVCIGADCPALSIRHFRAAQEALDSGADAVFGPTPDGGYYLVGMSQPQPVLFERIPWSSENTLTATLERARERGLTYALLSMESDIDTPADFERAKQTGSLPSGLTR